MLQLLELTDSRQNFPTLQASFLPSITPAQIMFLVKAVPKTALHSSSSRMGMCTAFSTDEMNPSKWKKRMNFFALIIIAISIWVKVVADDNI